ncbi:MAG: hypothetical protein M1546_13610 [Chloroflexi bacterium]|nr:hypothetical protein [Chloroflexota bacterium]
MKRYTGYIVYHKQNKMGMRWDEKAQCLWACDYAEVFSSRRAARTAITKSLEFASMHGHQWVSWHYQIVPIVGRKEAPAGKGHQ